MTGILIREGQKEIIDRHWGEDQVKMEAETSVMQPQAEGSGSH